MNWGQSPRIREKRAAIIIMVFMVFLLFRVLETIDRSLAACYSIKPVIGNCRRGAPVGTCGIAPYRRTCLVKGIYF